MDDLKEKLESLEINDLNNENLLTTVVKLIHIVNEKLTHQQSQIDDIREEIKSRGVWEIKHN